ncbi:MAG: hypothetical protein ACYC6F_13975 [Longimicrobiales bacterium]
MSATEPHAITPRRSHRALGSPAVVAGLVGAAWLALAGPLSAQAAGAPATASAEASLALTTLDGGAAWIGSATALLGLTSRISLGGGGSVLLGTRSLPGSARGTDQELRTAFGGLVVQFDAARREDRHLWLRVLAGAGNAKMDLALVGTQIASDNFGVLVPEVGVSVRLSGPLRVGAALGYRAVLGVDDLPGLAPSDLRGPSVRVLLSVHRF